MASRLVRPVLALRPAVISSGPTLRRTFAVSSARQIKESAGDDKDYDKHKKDLLQKHKDGKGHWKPELASDGEEAIRADRTPKEDISKLQERTKNHAQEKARTGTSAKDPM